MNTRISGHFQKLCTGRSFARIGTTLSKQPYVKLFYALLLSIQYQLFTAKSIANNLRQRWGREGDGHIPRARNGKDRVCSIDVLLPLMLCPMPVISLARATSKTGCSHSFHC
jgi:hypothetical protein